MMKQTPSRQKDDLPGKGQQDGLRVSWIGEFLDYLNVNYPQPTVDTPRCNGEATVRLQTAIKVGSDKAAVSKSNFGKFGVAHGTPNLEMKILIRKSKQCPDDSDNELFA
jgi:hypothetical protein